MKRNMDLVRDILLQIEATIRPNLANLELGPVDYEIVAEHIEMLIDEAGFLKGVDATHLQGKNFINLEITWQGHEYLDTIRDPIVWRKTKEGAQKVGGLSMELMGDLAKGYVKKLVLEKTDIEI